MSQAAELPALPPRLYKLARKSAETDIQVEINLDGQGQCEVSTGFGLLDHMLTLTAFWAKMDLHLSCQGDLHIDAHHSAEDVGIVLGQAIKGALGERRGIQRTAWAMVPMDEALARVALDLSGRSWLVWQGDDLLPPVMGGEEKDLWREFYKALAAGISCNLHILFEYGKNGHHLLESAAKGLGLALGQAMARNGENIPSTKGRLD